MKLDECRKAIDEIDAGILKLLNRRAALSKEIGFIKASAGLPVVDLHREAQVLRCVREGTTHDMSSDALARIYGEILAESRRIQLTIESAVIAKERIVR